MINLLKESLLQPHWIRPINIGTFDVVKYTMWIVLSNVCTYGTMHVIKLSKKSLIIVSYKIISYNIGISHDLRYTGCVSNSHNLTGELTARTERTSV